MNRKFIKNLALSLVIMNLFSSNALALTKNNQYNNKSTKINYSKYVLVNKDKKNPIYKRIDEKTGKKVSISIFDDENIANRQYGGNQEDFRDHFQDLIKDPLIWKEMQKYYPVENFDNENIAMFFYEKYFDLIRENGCGYVSAVNYIFRMFEGHEDKFYQTFGFPMYKMHKSYIDFNYEILILKFFNYYNLDKLKLYNTVYRTMAQDLCYFILEDYINHEGRTVIPKNARSLTEKQWKKLYKKNREHQKRIEELKAKYEKARNIDYNFGIPLKSSFGHIRSFLKQYKIDANISFIENCRARYLTTDSIVASQRLDLYQIDEDGNYRYANTDIPPHYVYVTNVEKNKTIIVSSWGYKYIYDTSKSKEISRIIIKTKKPIK